MYCFAVPQCASAPATSRSSACGRMHLSSSRPDSAAASSAACSDDAARTGDSIPSLSPVAARAGCLSTACASATHVSKHRVTMAENPPPLDRRQCHSPALVATRRRAAASGIHEVGTAAASGSCCVPRTTGCCRMPRKESKSLGSCSRSGTHLSSTTLASLSQSDSDSVASAATSANRYSTSL